MSRGFTMLEIMIVLVLVGLLAGVSGVAFRSLKPGPGAPVLRELQATRDSAVRAGEPRLWTREESLVRFEPDGSSSGGRVDVGGVTFVIDAITGEIREVP